MLPKLTTAVLSIALLHLGLSAAYANAEQKFVKLVEGIKSYEAHFVQTIQDERGAAISTLQGEMKVLRPGKFYWKSNPPDAIMVVADGTHLWTYDIELEQVTKQQLALALSSSPAAVLMGSTHQLLEDFSVSELPQAECTKQQHQCFNLKPKTDSDMFQNIHVIFNQSQLVEVSMQDPLGQHIETQFSKIKVNGTLKESLFKFSPPPGVDVLTPSAANQYQTFEMEIAQ